MAERYQNIMIPEPFQEDSVLLTHGEWTEDMSLYVKSITEWAVRNLQVYFNCRATLVEEIAHLHFTALTQLHLVSNNVESIEGLSRVRMAHIKMLYLTGNNITSVRVVRRIVWPALEEFGLENNYFGEGKDLVQGSLAQLQELYLFITWEEDEDKNKWAESRFSAKMQASSLKRLNIRRNRFSNNRSIARVLQRRWPDVGIQ